MEKAFNPDVLLLRLDHLAEEQASNRDQLAKGIAELQRGVDRINSRVQKNTELAAYHETRIALMENFCKEQVKPALQLLADHRVQIAVMAAKYGAVGLGVGGGVGLVIWIISALTGTPLPSP
jgi:hypothetical protein